MSEITRKPGSYDAWPTLPRKGELVGVQMPDGTIQVETYGRPRVDEVRRLQESLLNALRTCERLTKPSLWQHIRRWLTKSRPWIALLGWLPPIYLVGLVVNSDKLWVHSDFLFDLGGNTPIFWWPTRLYKHRKRGGF